MSSKTQFMITWFQNFEVDGTKGDFSRCSDHCRYVSRRLPGYYLQKYTWQCLIPCWWRLPCSLVGLGAYMEHLQFQKWIYISGIWWETGNIRASDGTVLEERHHQNKSVCSSVWYGERFCRLYLWTSIADTFFIGKSLLDFYSEALCQGGLDKGGGSRLVCHEQLQATDYIENQFGLAFTGDEVVQKPEEAKTHYRLAAINWILAALNLIIARQGPKFGKGYIMQQIWQTYDWFFHLFIYRIPVMPAHLEWMRSLQAMQGICLHRSRKRRFQIPNSLKFPT